MKTPSSTSHPSGRPGRAWRRILAICVACVLILGLLYILFDQSEHKEPPSAAAPSADAIKPAIANTSATTVSAPLTTPVRIVLWNTHNFKYKDRGTKR